MQWVIVVTAAEDPNPEFCLVYGDFPSARHANSHLKQQGWTPLSDGNENVFVSPDKKRKASTRPLNEASELK